MEPTPCVPELRIKQVAAGGMHSCVLTEAGEVCFLLLPCVLCNAPPFLITLTWSVQGSGSRI